MRWIGLAWIGLVWIVGIAVLESETGPVSPSDTADEAFGEAQPEEDDMNRDELRPAPPLAERKDERADEFSCRLSLLADDRLRLELTNRFPKKPVTINWTYQPAWNLRLEFTDEKGMRLYTFSYGNLKSIFPKPKKLIIEPEQAYSAKTYFPRREVEEAISKAGVYRVRGIFHYDEGIVASEPIEVTLKPRAK